MKTKLARYHLKEALRALKDVELHEMSSGMVDSRKWSIQIDEALDFLIAATKQLQEKYEI